jgi:hypothetical protein
MDAFPRSGGSCAFEIVAEFDTCERVMNVAGGDSGGGYWRGDAGSDGLHSALRQSAWRSHCRQTAIARGRQHRRSFRIHRILRRAIQDRMIERLGSSTAEIKMGFPIG